MKAPEFTPGFRLSIVDGAVLVVGAVGIPLLWSMTWWWGYVIGFVLIHFFLFCNVFRVARPLELAWAGVFVVLAGATVATENPGWLIASSASLCTTVVVVLVEMRKPSYHGIG